MSEVLPPVWPIHPHTVSPTHSHSQIHVYSQTHTCVHTHNFMHTCTHAVHPHSTIAHVHTLTCTYGHSRTYIHTLTHTHVHIPKHTVTRTHPHTHIGLMETRRRRACCASIVQQREPPTHSGEEGDPQQPVTGPGLRVSEESDTQMQQVPGIHGPHASPPPSLIHSPSPTLSES